MKRILVGLLAVTGFLFQGCDKELSGDDYDFSNSLPPYVTIPNVDTIKLAPGDTATVTFSMRTAMQQEVMLKYKVEGAITLADQTVIIERNSTSTVATIPIPTNIIVAPDTAAHSTLTLLSAAKADGAPLTIGQRNNPDNQKVIISALK